MSRALRGALALLSLFALGAQEAGAETIASARYETPVERYGHFALGRPHEYARLIATTGAGRTLELELPENEVFEDLAPRIVKLAPGEPDEILAIVSARESGSRLVLVRAGEERLEVSAESPAIGTPMRWLNPVGVADLDGDGRAEIAAVTTPHIGGTLRVYRRSGERLVEIASLGGFSNHVYGSPELGLASPVSIDGRMRLSVPDATRSRTRIIALEGARLVEVAPVAAKPENYVAAVSCTSGPYRVKLPNSYKALRTLGHLRRERVLKTGDEGTHRELRFNGLELVVVTPAGKPNQYQLSKAILTTPSWRIAGPLRVGTSASIALRGLLKNPPREGELEFNGDKDTIRVSLARGRVFDVEYSCSAE